jgi:hypothetical protein
VWGIDREGLRGDGNRRGGSGWRGESAGKTTRKEKKKVNEELHRAGLVVVGSITSHPNWALARPAVRNMLLA